MTDIIPRFKNNLLLLCWFIDDISGIWVPGDGKSFKESKESLQQYRPGKLKWVVSVLADNVIMLELMIKSKDKKLLHARTRRI